ncbi:Hypothetical predicted protein, partial [Paramuricea clavata]
PLIITGLKCNRYIADWDMNITATIRAFQGEGLGLVTVIIRAFQGDRLCLYNQSFSRRGPGVTATIRAFQEEGLGLPCHSQLITHPQFTPDLRGPSDTLDFAVILNLLPSFCGGVLGVNFGKNIGETLPIALKNEELEDE